MRPSDWSMQSPGLIPLGSRGWQWFAMAFVPCHPMHHTAGGPWPSMCWKKGGLESSGPPSHGLHCQSAPKDSAQSSPSMFETCTSLVPGGGWMLFAERLSSLSLSLSLPSLGVGQGVWHTSFGGGGGGVGPTHLLPCQSTLGCC